MDGRILDRILEIVREESNKVNEQSTSTKKGFDGADLLESLFKEINAQNDHVCDTCDGSEKFNVTRAIIIKEKARPEKDEGSQHSCESEGSCKQEQILTESFQPDSCVMPVDKKAFQEGNLQLIFQISPLPKLY